VFWFFDWLTAARSLQPFVVMEKLSAANLKDKTAVAVRPAKKYSLQ
jgi:hypothetical protein